MPGAWFTRPPAPAAVDRRAIAAAGVIPIVLHAMSSHQSSQSVHQKATGLLDNLAVEGALRKVSVRAVHTKLNV